jgi:hypothetical protein
MYTTITVYATLDLLLPPPDKTSLLFYIYIYIY